MNERRGIKHHLLDIADVRQEFSAGHFLQAAREATQDILRVKQSPFLDACDETCLCPQQLLIHCQCQTSHELKSHVVVGAARKGSNRGRRNRLLLALVHLWQAAHAGVDA